MQWYQCSGINAGVSMQWYQCSGINTGVSCSGINAVVSMQWYRCSGINAVVSMQWYQCRGINTGVSIQGYHVVVSSIRGKIQLVAYSNCFFKAPMPPTYTMFAHSWHDKDLHGIDHIIHNVWILFPTSWEEIKTFGCCCGLTTARCVASRRFMYSRSQVFLTTG